MNTLVESTLEAEAITKRGEEVIPLQERLGVQVAESAQETAEVVLTASRLEVREEAGPLFVP